MEKIMVIDDNPVNLKLARAALADEFEVVPFTSGGQALKALERLNAAGKLPRLILLDVEMPDMNGFAVLAALKAHGHSSHIPVVFLTGNESAHAEEQGRELGAVDYITKPFSSDQLKQSICRHLSP